MQTIVKEDRSKGMFGESLRVITNAINNDDHETPKAAGGYYDPIHCRWAFSDGSLLSKDVWNRHARKLSSGELAIAELERVLDKLADLPTKKIGEQERQLNKLANISRHGRAGGPGPNRLYHDMMNGVMAAEDGIRDAIKILEGEGQS